jgi:hypothetical protein
MSAETDEAFVAFVGGAQRELWTLAWLLTVTGTASDFSVEVNLDRHSATKNTMAWNEGPNTRFIRFTSTSESNDY